MARTEWLTVEDLAAELRVPKSTVYKWRSVKYGPRAARVGKYLRYRRDDVDAWLATCLDDAA